MCVAVESTPEGVTAAHNCSMKAIGVQGPYRAYQLQTADLTCSSLAELTVYNIRRLFVSGGGRGDTAALWRGGLGHCSRVESLVARLNPSYPKSSTARTIFCSSQPPLTPLTLSNRTHPPSPRPPPPTHPPIHPPNAPG